MAEKILDEATKIDLNEDAAMGEENKNFFNPASLEKIKEQIEKCKEALENSQHKVSLVDKDARFMKHAGGHGRHMSYNAQISVDRNGVILEVDVVNKPADDGELLKERVKAVEENTNNEVKKVVADAGYFETSAVKELADEGKEIIVPSSVSYKKNEKFYSASEFKYDEVQDKYICPAQKSLEFCGKRRSRGKDYVIYAAKKEDCAKCHLKEKCYKGKSKARYGRTIMFFKDKEFLEKYKVTMEKNKVLLKARKSIIEPVIGFIKCRLKFRKFLLRGLEKAKGEFTIIAVAYNLIKIRNLIKARVGNNLCCYVS